MSKLSTIMTSSLLASAVTAAAASTDNQSCMDSHTSQRDRGECLINKTIVLGRVAGEDATYVVGRAHEINAYDPIHGKHMGMLNLHWGSVQEEPSESYGNIANRPGYAQENFAQAVQETCKGTKENLEANGDAVKAEIEAFGKQYTHRATNPILRKDDYTNASRKMQTLERFTTRYCPDFE